jgi:hypothetical protein
VPLVPAMRGVHASPNYIATAVVLVVPIAGGVRVIAASIPIRGIAILISIRIRVSVVVIEVIIRVAGSESEAAAPEIAIMESTTTKFAESRFTAETAIMECHATAAGSRHGSHRRQSRRHRTTTEATAMASANAARVARFRRFYLLRKYFDPGIS